MDGEEACVMEAVIREKSFAGGQLRIVFELKDGQRITANRYGIDVDRKVGETIKVGWNKEQAVLVQDVEETEHGERKEA